MRLGQRAGARVTSLGGGEGSSPEGPRHPVTARRAPGPLATYSLLFELNPWCSGCHRVAAETRCVGTEEECEEALTCCCFCTMAPEVFLQLIQLKTAQDKYLATQFLYQRETIGAILDIRLRKPKQAGVTRNMSVNREAPTSVFLGNIIAFPETPGAQPPLRTLI